MEVRGERANEDVSIEQAEHADEMPGKMDSQTEEQKLMHSVLENDEQVIADGKLLQEALDNGTGNFTPDLLFDKLVTNFQEAEQLFGETILREATGYDAKELERNIRLPEFKRMLKEEMTRRLKKMQERGMLDSQFGITDQGFLLAALVLIKDELDHLLTTGYGRREQDAQRDERGEEITRLRGRYRDFDLKKTMHTLAKRGRDVILPEDIRFRENTSEGKVSIIYALDCSGSMKGKKLGLAKRAGVALAYKAIENGDDVGLIAFGAQVETTVAPSKKFMDLVHALVTVKARAETNITLAITSAIPLLTGKSKHLILLTDGLHTAGTTQEVLAAAQAAKNQGVSISIVGINLDKEGEALSESIINITEGRFYRVQNIEELDLLILEDYARLKR